MLQAAWVEHPRCDDRIPWESRSPVVDESQNSTLASISPPAKNSEPDQDWSGRTIGEFAILRCIGRGGMGQVYLAEQTSLKRKVAVKMLRPELSANKNSLQRFEDEAKAVAKLNHPNIVQIYTINEQDGNHYMALEYVEGRNLRDYLNRKGSPELPVCLNLMRQIASALQRAHESGFIHRDVKPENILLTRKGEVKVTDFGLSRCFTDGGQQVNLTQSGVTMGTPLYMSPEQVQGKPADIRSDIYSYGVTCYHLFAGQPPFRGASAFDVAVQHVQNEPPSLTALRPDLPADLVAMIQKMMAKKPEDRYQSFKEILRDIAKLRESVTGGMPLAPMSLPGPGSSSATLSAPTESAVNVVGRAPIQLGSNKWVPRIVVAVILAGMLLGGVTMRLAIHRLTAKEAGPRAESNEPPPYVSNEERFALELAKKFADPDSSPDELRRGIGFQVDLLAYYLKKGRLDDAEQFVTELQNHKYKATRFQTHPYQALAKLGHAMILAFRDRPEEALKQMGSLITTAPILPRPALGGLQSNQYVIAGVPSYLFEYPELRRLIADALNRIATDLHVTGFEKYPQLDAIRKSPNKPFRPGIK